MAEGWSLSTSRLVTNGVPQEFICDLSSLSFDIDQCPESEENMLVRSVYITMWGEVVMVKVRSAGPGHKDLDGLEDEANTTS